MADTFVGMGAVTLRLGALTLLCVLVLGVGTARAEVGAPTPTVQAVAADATWLAYTPPPEHPGIVCMVDSGVDPNPDTEAAVIGGQALAPETETNDEIARLEPRAQPGNHPNGHGTLMAMMMAAPINGWGMVGIAPTSVRVYNMKALPKGQTTFPFNYYVIGLKECEQKHQTVLPAMMVISLSLGVAASPDGTELMGLGNFVASAYQSDLAVVAAAGNEGGPVIYPAAYPSVLAVGAGDSGSGPGALCPFASRGETLDVIAPGCDSETAGLQGAFEDDGSPAFGSGSSQASAIVSAVLASMRAYAPQLTYAEAEECLTTTTKNGSIDATAAFDACGLAQIVSEGQMAELAASGGSGQGANSNNNQTISLAVCGAVLPCSQPLPAPASDTPDTSTGFESKSRCPRPQGAKVASRDNHRILRVRGRPEGCRLQARLLVKQGGEYRWHLTPGQLATVLRLPILAYRRIEARFASGATSRSPSAWITLRAAGGGL